MSARVKPQPRPIDEAVEHYVTRAREARDAGPAEFDIEPTLWQRRAESASDELALARTDGVDALQFTPRFEKLSWEELLGTLVKRSHASASQVPEPVQSENPPSTDEVINKAADVVNRVRNAIRGPAEERALWEPIYEFVFSGREITRTRNGYETELKAIDAAIVTLGGKAPAELVALRPGIGATIQTLNDALRPRGRPVTPPAPPRRTREAEIDALALKLALGDLLRWSSVVATPKRDAALRRVIDPPPRRPNTAAPTPTTTPLTTTETPTGETC